MSRERIATGLKVDEIIKMPLSKYSEYTEKQQKEIASRLISAANKRIKKFEVKGETSPALRKLNESGGKLSVKGKSGDEIINEFIRARDFLKNRFSKISEYNKVIKKLSNAIDSSQYITKQAFNLYEELRETDPQLVKEEDKYKTLDRIMYYLEETNLSKQDIINEQIDYLDGLYRARQNKTDYSNPFKTLL